MSKEKYFTAQEIERMPVHIAAIMDGNGRWATKRGLPRTAGHKAGSETFRRAAEFMSDLGVKYFTVYAKNIGVDVDNLYISQPDNGEQAMEITETMVRSGAIDIVIVDSVAALVPKAEIDGDMGDS
ncbi:MAG: undecaprenyl diphosphate synthase family protein, partial [Clostridia bacterium]|nr:undecaprenyl diphosphate synthase family protein [Clostridia bacterium]